MSTRITTRRRAAGCVALFTTVTAAGAIAAAGPAAADRASDAGIAYVRTAHLSPDTPKVDVYLTAFRGGSTKLWVKNVGYGDASPYRRMTAGQYAVSMRPAGAAKSTPAALSWTVTLKPGASYTAAAIGEQKNLHGIVIPDSSSTPASGKALVRVVQAADQAKNVAVRAGDTTVSDDLAFGSVSHYVSVPAGTTTLTSKALADQGLQGSSPLKVASRSAVTVLLLDKQGGGLQTRTLLDAAGPAHAPAGSVPAGGGGTATEFVNTADPGAGVAAWAGAGALVLAALGFGAFSITRRRGAAAA